MEEKILSDLKTFLGFQEDENVFETELILYLNQSALVTYQLGLIDNYVTIKKDTTWKDLKIKDFIIEGYKTYIFMSVSLAFDPPSNSTVLEHRVKLKDELGWRLCKEIDINADTE